MDNSDLMKQYYDLIKTRKVYTNSDTNNNTYQALSENCNINIVDPTENDINIRLQTELNNRQNIILPNKSV